MLLVVVCLVDLVAVAVISHRIQEVPAHLGKDLQVDQVHQYNMVVLEVVAALLLLAIQLGVVKTVEQAELDIPGL
jgi:hypothetical protein